MNGNHYLRVQGAYRPLLLALALILSTLGGVVATVGPALAQEGTATIEITNYACPEEFDAYSATPDELAEACFLADMFPPVTFTLDHPDGTSIQAETVDGYVTFEDVTPSSDVPVTLSEVLPEGLGEPVVACTVTNQADGAVIVETTLVPVVNGNAIQFAPEAGGTLSCNWFNVFGADSAPDDAAPGTEDSSPAADGLAPVTVVVHGCPDGFDAAVPPVDLLGACQGHPVILLSAGDFEDYYEADTTPGTADGNAVRFDGVPAAELSLTQLRPSSVTTLAVFCTDGAADDPASWQQAPVASGMGVDWDVESGAQLTCHWFSDGGDVAGDTSGNTVEIKAWTCVPGTEPDQDDWSYYFDNCETADPDTAFTLTGTGGARPAEAAGEWATWIGVANGEIIIQGSIPDGYGEPVVVCGAYLGNNVSIDWPDASSGAFTHVFAGEASQILTCDWFNIPTGEGARSTSMASRLPEEDVRR